MQNKKVTFFSIVVLMSLMMSLVFPTGIVLADDTPPPAPETPQAVTLPTEVPVVDVAPTEIPLATDVPTEVPTEVPTQEAPVDPSSTVSDVLSQVPAGTDVVVLNASGEVLPLASQQAADIVAMTDPMWCPANTLPGGTNCSPIPFSNSQALINAMEASNPSGVGVNSIYEQHGIIYFTVNPGAGSFTLIPGNGNAITTADYNALKPFNLILQGGWNGENLALATFSGQTTFGTNPFTIGTFGNPWAGDITLNNFAFSGVSNGNAVTIYTTTGNIKLDNVDVLNQTNGTNTAVLNSASGNITVQNGSSFDGRNDAGTNGSSRWNQGFSATTTSGSISITGNSGGTNPYTFRQAFQFGGTNYNGATLSAPTVTLDNVIARENDGNGIAISGATTINLTAVTAGVAVNNGGNGGSGVYVNGTGTNPTVNVTGGSFNRNVRYGIEIISGYANIISSPSYGTNTNANGLGNISVTAPADTTPPVITVPADMTVQATGSTGAVVTFTASALDAVSGARTTTCLPVSGSTFAIGKTTVTCSATDAAGNTGSNTFTVTVVDTTAPVVTVPSNMTVEATSSAGAVVTFAASALDAVSGARTTTCSPPSGSTFAIGTTTVTCSATDAAGNTGSNTFTVTVRDMTAPVVTVPSNMTVEATGSTGAIVTFTASATDSVDGAITPTCSPVSGSTFAIGTTTVTCTATDAYLNTGSNTFTVTVGDTTAPVVTVPSNITKEATSSSGATAIFSASASDIVDGSLPASCDYLSGSTFAIGTTTVTCSATDVAGNTGSKIFTITVRDTTSPVVTVPANITKEATGSSGATATFSASASDIVDGALATTCSPASGSTFAIGTTTVTCSTTDSADNTDSGSFTVTVEDTTSPIITVPANITKEATGSTGALVTFTASASDIVDGALTTTCSPASGLTFAIGTTTVTCSASDSAGNTSSSTFNIQITDVEKNNKSLITFFGFAPLLIPVTGGQPTDLTCFDQYTTLGMADFKVVFSNLCGYSTLLANALEDSLFGALPKNVNFVSGLDIVLLHNNAPVHTIPVDGSITISIDIPSGMKGETLAILFWDTAAGAWVEKNATIENGKMVLTIDTLGTFVLVDKSTPSAMNGALDIADILNGFYLAMTDFFKQFATN